MFFKKKIRKPVPSVQRVAEKIEEQHIEPVKKETKRVRKETKETVSEENKIEENFSEQ